MGELSKAQGLQVAGQSCHHAQQQLRKMLSLDLYVGLLDVKKKDVMREYLEKG